MWQELLAAVALVLIIEGILPFLTPRQFRKTMLTAAKLNDRALRTGGFVSMAFGLFVLYVVR